MQGWKVGRLEGWKVGRLMGRKPNIFVLRAPHSPLRTLLILLPLLFLSSNCYYSTSASALPPTIKTVAIPLFQNETFETDIKEQLTDAIVEKFLENNQLRVVDVRDADAMVIGTITDVREEALAFSQGIINELRIWIVVNVRFEDVGNRNVLWEEEELLTFGDCEVVTGTETDREKGIELAVIKMADEILNRTVSGW
jgi:outer membrane lipopolysaccharide assembly protein LptE/RlpB